MVSTLKQFFSSVHITFVIENILSADAFVQGITNEYSIVFEKLLIKILFFSNISNTLHHFSMTFFEKFFHSIILIYSTGTT